MFEVAVDELERGWLEFYSLPYMGAGEAGARLLFDDFLTIYAALSSFVGFAGVVRVARAFRGFAVAGKLCVVWLVGAIRSALCATGPSLSERCEKSGRRAGFGKMAVAVQTDADG